VVDEAGILDANTRAVLDRKLADLDARTTDQLVVATVKSLQSLTIEDYGIQLARRWALGQKGRNNGVLLLVAPSERKVRIEVGYGLEGELTDAVTKYIIDNSILPRFRANDMPDGIRRGVDELVQALSNDVEWHDRFKRAQPTLFRRLIAGIGGLLSWIPGDFLIIIGLLLLGCTISSLSMLTLWVILPFGLYIANALGLGSKAQQLWLLKHQRHFHFFGFMSGGGGMSVSGSSRSSGSSWSSSEGGSSFSGGGGSFGGGGSSGSW
jgi:uncharacterized protein